MDPIFEGGSLLNENLSLFMIKFSDKKSMDAVLG
jgi:hypothetical protein